MNDRTHPQPTLDWPQKQPGVTEAQLLLITVLKHFRNESPFVTMRSPYGYEKTQRILNTLRTNLSRARTDARAKGQQIEEWVLYTHYCKEQEDGTTLLTLAKGVKPYASKVYQSPDKWVQHDIGAEIALAVKSICKHVPSMAYFLEPLLWTVEDCQREATKAMLSDRSALVQSQQAGEQGNE